MIETEKELSRTPEAEAPEERAGRTTTFRAVGGATVVEAVVGAGAVVLAIIGLTSVVPMFMATIATLAIAATLLAEGTGIAARFRSLESGLTSRNHKMVLGGGMGAEILVGLVGAALGILALVGVLPWTLLGIAAIVFGGGYIASGGVEIEAESVVGDGKDRLRHYAHRAVKATAGARMLVGACAAALGIVGLAIGFPVLPVLSLVALLGLGGISLISGTAFGTRMITALHH